MCHRDLVLPTNHDNISLPIRYLSQVYINGYQYLAKCNCTILFCIVMYAHVFTVLHASLASRTGQSISIKYLYIAIYSETLHKKIKHWFTYVCLNLQINLLTNMS